MTPTLLQQIKEANKRYLAGSPQLLNSAGDAFIVLACMDPRLTGVLEPLLGLPKHRAIVIRTAGNLVSDANRDVLRSVAVALFTKGAREIFIAGHTDCALSKFSAPEVIEIFRKAGIPRSAFGEEDLRIWFGAFTDIKANILQGVDCLRKSGFVPRDIKIHGLIIGTETGDLEVVFDGDAVPPEAAPPKAGLAESAASVPVVSSKVTGSSARTSQVPAEAPKGTKGPVVIAALDKLRKAKQPESLLDAAMVVRDFISRERQNAQFELTIAQIDALIKRERDPVRIVTELEAIVEGYKSKYPELPGALEYLKRSVQAGGSSAGFGFKELMKRMLE